MSAESAMPLSTFVVCQCTEGVYLLDCWTPGSCQQITIKVNYEYITEVAAHLKSSVVECRMHFVLSSISVVWVWKVSHTDSPSLVPLSSGLSAEKQQQIIGGTTVKATASWGHTYSTSGTGPSPQAEAMVIHTKAE